MKQNLPTSSSLEELLHIVSNPEVYQSRVTELKALNLQLAQRLSDLGVVDEINAMSLRAQAKLDEAKSVREQADEYSNKVRSEADSYYADVVARLKVRDDLIHTKEEEQDVQAAKLYAEHNEQLKKASELDRQQVELMQQAEQLKAQQSELLQKRSYLETGIKKLQDFIANG